MCRCDATGVEDAIAKRNAALRASFEQFQVLLNGVGRETAPSAPDAAAPYDTRPIIEVLQSASTALSDTHFLRLGLRAFRLFSVDGGHTTATAHHDLNLISCLVVPGAIVALDDWSRTDWPGVTEGVLLCCLLVLSIPHPRSFRLLSVHDVSVTTTQ